MSMSKKNYQRIAAIIAEARGRRDDNRLESLLWLTKKMSDYLAEENPRFDAYRFMVACMSSDEASQVSPK